MLRQTLSLCVPALLLPVLLLGAAVSAQAQAPEISGPQGQFYKIGVQHYDAGMMADLVTRQDAIVVVPPNFVIAEDRPAPALSGGPAVTALGGPNGRSAPGPALVAVPPVPANNRLPEGVERIYALRADNSLVVETTPDFQTTPDFRYSQPATSPISQKGSTP